MTGWTKVEDEPLCAGLSPQTQEAIVRAAEKVQIEGTDPKKD